MARTGITTRHCQCKQCLANSKRVCKASCGHNDRYVVRKRMPDGKQRWKTFPTYKQAERFLADLEGEWRDQVVESALGNNKGKLTLNEAWEDHHKVRSIDIRPGTAEGRALLWRVHLQPVWGEFTIESITKDDVQQLIIDWMDEGASPSSIRNRLGVLLPLLQYGGNNINRTMLRIPKDDVDDAVDLDKFLEKDQIKAIVDALPDEYKLPVTFMAYVGTRIGETLELRQGDIINGQRMKVARAYNKGTKKVTKTKNGKSRIVWVPPALVKALKSGAKGKNALLFTDAEGNRLNYYQAIKTFRSTRDQLIEQGKLPEEKAEVTFHDLRHSCASVLADKGASILVVAQQLGHSDPSITARVYAHLFPSAVDSLMGKLDEEVEALLM